MKLPEDNPHLANEMPGSWDVPFKKWLLGIAAFVFFLVLGVGNLVDATCSVPVPRGRFNGFAWMTLEGAGARWFGLCQIGAGVFLHGRFFWRYHRRFWTVHERIQNGSVILMAVSVVMTYVFLWRTQF